jgi:hypothetical protein
MKNLMTKTILSLSLLTSINSLADTEVVEKSAFAKAAKAVKAVKAVEDTDSYHTNEATLGIVSVEQNLDDADEYVEN